jgi:hypothetical protein
LGSLSPAVWLPSPSLYAKTGRVGAEHRVFERVVEAVLVDVARVARGERRHLARAGETCAWPRADIDAGCNHRDDRVGVACRRRRAVRRAVAVAARSRRVAVAAARAGSRGIAGRGIVRRRRARARAGARIASAAVRARNGEGRAGEERNEGSGARR